MSSRGRARAPRARVVIGVISAILAIGAAIAAAGLSVGVLVALTLLSVAAAPRVSSLDWGGFRAWWRLQTRPLGKGTAIASVNAIWPSLRRLLRPDYVFVTYPGTEAHKRLYFPPWVERTLRPVFPSGVIRFGSYWGVIVSAVATAEDLQSSPDRLRSLLSETGAQFPDVRVIALAGRLPGVAEKTGVGLTPPFIHGDRGTVCAMVAATHEQARLLGREEGEVCIALVGSGGFIGSRLVASLASEFGRVIALDPRFEGRSRGANGVAYTDRPADVGEAQAVLVLTAHGADTASIASHVAEGAIVADDTHPEMPAAIRAKMEARGATVLKASVADARIEIIPPIPTFRADDIPGCLLEALVVVQRGREVLESQAAFNEAASELGFRGRLAPHLNATEKLAAPAPARETQDSAWVPSRERTGPSALGAEIGQSEAL